MPHQFTLVQAGDFIRAGTYGTIDLDESRRVLTSLAENLVSQGVDRALLDLRRASADPPLTYPQLYELAQAFRQAGFGPKHKLAMLVPLQRYEKAQFFAICASGRGWNCHPFESFEEAVDWLSDSVELPQA